MLLLYRLSLSKQAKTQRRNLKISCANLKIFRRFQFHSWRYWRFILAFSLHFRFQSGEESDHVEVAVFGYLAGCGGEECFLQSGEFEDELVDRCVIGGL